MIHLKTIGRRQLRTLLKLQTPSNHLNNPKPQNPFFLISSNSFEHSFLSSIHCRPFSLSAQSLINSEEKSQKSKQPLSVFFKEAVGLSESTDKTVFEVEDDAVNASLKKNLIKLEEEVRSLNKKRHEKGGAVKPPSGKGKLIAKNEAKRSLWALFADDKKREEVTLIEPIRTDFGNEDPMVHKELSSDMQMFARHLYVEGYLKTASFAPKDRFDPTCFEVSYAREFLKYAAVKFGKDHQEISKWLSASDLKKVALFGCPSLGQRSIYAAKHMRKFFEIEEHKASLPKVHAERVVQARKYRIAEISQRVAFGPFSISAQSVINSEEKSQKSKQPLSVFFKEAVGLSESTDKTVFEDEDDAKNASLKKNLRKLEEEVMSLNKKRHEKGEAPKPPSGKGKLIEKNEAKRSLWAFFADDKKREEVTLIEPIRTDFGNEDPMVHKELSPDMQMFARHLYVEGYLKTASFAPKDKFDPTCFEVSYAREFLKYAAVKFGKDHQEIAKWLSASDLKKVEPFSGAHLLDRRVSMLLNICANSLKSRNTRRVCQKCTLKESCKHANIVSQKSPKELHLGSVTRVLAMYALESVPQQLVVPQEIKNPVSRLLKELGNLSQTVS
ncbi:hypothetical protein BUALT_Bualt03G0149600 [Buddleja alternifolia]|uniref:Uncharacterized protein n=1 Tax=Buddleja alternifolia TaxID=168488 RepID=A0AAV6Y0Q3_9LAMI|nr:hypothetical protein BUALT_Bualt03G0149600 [Buddleja alternifolia]